MYCKECGFQLSDDAKFCPNCGTKVEQNGIGNIKQKAVFGKIEKDAEVNADSIDEKAHWSNEQEQHKKATEVHKAVERKKIIRTKATTSPNIYVSYYSFEDDKSSAFSPFWYVDSIGTPMSEYFDNLSLMIINNTTMVKKSEYHKWACGRFEYDGNRNLKLKITTKYLFDDFDSCILEDGNQNFLLRYNRDVYGHDGKVLYKMKKTIDVPLFLAFLLILIMVGVMCSSAVFLVVKSLLSRLN